MTTQTTTAAWPEGVTARYLTDAGKALVDPTITVDLREAPDAGDISGICRGCESTFDDSNYISRDPIAGRHWAQSHAETCRAIPKPTT